ncbi:MAG: ankyrin repeat domain-containing protein [Epsilonproteobacteria bacterium]|nr:ankyrin repeat domain-containing protein [Campylobacterota bacterium]
MIGCNMPVKRKKLFIAALFFLTEAHPADHFTHPTTNFSKQSPRLTRQLRATINKYYIPICSSEDEQIKSMQTILGRVATLKNNNLISPDCFELFTHDHQLAISGLLSGKLAISQSSISEKLYLFYTIAPFLTLNGKINFITQIIGEMYNKCRNQTAECFVFLKKYFLLNKELAMHFKETIVRLIGTNRVYSYNRGFLLGMVDLLDLTDIPEPQLSPIEFFSNVARMNIAKGYLAATDYKKLRTSYSNDLTLDLSSVEECHQSIEKSIREHTVINLSPSYLRQYLNINGPHDYVAEAVNYSNPTALKLLIELGVPLNKPDPNWQTPLHVAASHGKIEIMTLLLGHGAKQYLRDMNGKIPVELAKENGYLIYWLEAMKGVGRN